ncbi:hypothetical protein BDW71DRAFT_170070 [Aspergillus fruticulosus]
MPSQRLWGVDNYCQNLTLWMFENGLLPSATDGRSLPGLSSDRFFSSRRRLTAAAKRPSAQISTRYAEPRRIRWLLPILVVSSLACPI